GGPHGAKYMSERAYSHVPTAGAVARLTVGAELGGAEHGAVGLLDVGDVRVAAALRVEQRHFVIGHDVAALVSDDDVAHREVPRELEHQLVPAIAFGNAFGRITVVAASARSRATAASPASATATRAARAIGRGTPCAFDADVVEPIAA